MKSYTKTVLDVVVKKISKNYFCEGRNVISNCQLERTLLRHVKDVVRGYDEDLLDGYERRKRKQHEKFQGALWVFAGRKVFFFLEWKEFTSNYSTARKWPTCSLITKSKSSSTLTIFWSCQNVLRSARGQPKAHPTLRLRVYDVTKFYDVINSQKFKLQQTKTHLARSAAVKNQTSCDRHFVGRTKDFSKGRRASGTANGGGWVSEWHSDKITLCFID